MKYSHWVDVSYTQDKQWLKIETVSSEQPLNAFHFKTYPRKGS